MTASSTVWVVTGATRGLGLEFCTQKRLRHCRSSRYSTRAGARPGESADELRALSEKYEGLVMIVEVELLDKDSVKAAMQQIQDTHQQGIDYLINNAGVLGRYTRAQDQDVDDLQQGFTNRVHKHHYGTEREKVNGWHTSSHQVTPRSCG